MRYVFFGSPAFAATVLERLIDAGLPPMALVCNPDRPAGRKKILTPPDTKKLVLTNQLPIGIYQPENKGELSALGDKLSDGADFGIVAAYALIIPDAFIKSFRLGIIGVHPSLLPKYRGASPIQSAILAGEKRTGTTLFMLDSEVDHGPIIASKELEIRDAYYGELANELAEVSGELLAEMLPDFSKGKLIPREQDHTLATATQKFGTEDAYINPDDLEQAQAGNLSKAQEALRKIRAFNPEPGAFTFINERRTKLLRARIEKSKIVLEQIQEEGSNPKFI
ncbi:MAG: methionyl-tRNA formyltransferase [Candidatus Colwellbacteria bacterium]|nr:methionyl-tRNA formyltransferase [Candidatus Colwellbacteria bacterium]